MALTLENRRVGDATVVTCRGRLVAGPESEALQQHLDALIPVSPHIVLHLGGIEFLDSAGLGLLVRCRARAENANASLKVCALSPKVEQILKVTRLTSTFQPYETEAEAIAGAHQSGRDQDLSSLPPNVLCLDWSQDVLAYLRALLAEAGYRVITAGNLPDALILLKATQPKVVVIGADLRAATGTRTADEFHTLAEAGAVIEIPEGFSAQDAGDAGERVLQAVRARAG